MISNVGICGGPRYTYLYTYLSHNEEKYDMGYVVRRRVESPNFDINRFIVIKNGLLSRFPVLDLDLCASGAMFASGKGRCRCVNSNWIDGPASQAYFGNIQIEAQEIRELWWVK